MYIYLILCRIMRLLDFKGPEIVPVLEYNGQRHSALKTGITS